MKAKAAEIMETRAATAPATDVKADTETPKGTLAILLGFAAILVALWGFIYIMMLLRG